MARILLRVGGGCAPYSTHRHGASSLFLAPGLAPPSRLRGWPAPPCLEAVTLRGERHIGGVGKKWLAPDRLNPDQQGIWSATLSLAAVSTMVYPIAGGLQ